MKAILRTLGLVVMTSTALLVNAVDSPVMNDYATMNYHDDPEIDGLKAAGIACGFTLLADLFFFAWIKVIID